MDIAPDVLKTPLSNISGRRPFSRIQYSSKRVPEVEAEPDSARMLKRRKLGAGAFMKNETLRGIDGRILRVGDAESFPSHGRTMYRTTCPYVRQSKHDSREERQPKKPPCEDFSDVENWHNDGSLWAAGGLDRQKEDEMFELFINSEACENVVVSSSMSL